MLLRQIMPCALALALLNAGRSIAARMAIMAITTSSSMRVKALTISDFGFRISDLILVFIVFLSSPSQVLRVDRGVSLTLLTTVHDRWDRIWRSLTPEQFARP